MNKIVETHSCVDPDLVHMADDLVQELKARRLSVVTAESCTGGLIATVLSQGDGASDALEGGFVTYTKQQKTTALGVSARLLAEKGSVNRDTVCAMAAGALQRSGADIALAVSGVLGPKEDEDGNPVGLVFLCCNRRGAGPLVVVRHFDDRSTDRLRYMVVRMALDLIGRMARESVAAGEV